MWSPADNSQPEKPPQAPHEVLAISLLLLLATLLRAVAWGRAVVMEGDGPIYLATAREIAEGRWGDALGSVYHPLYPVVVALAHGIGGDWEQAGAAVSIAAGVSAVLFLHLFLRDAFGAPTALLGSLLLAVHPQAIKDGSDIGSDGLYLALLLAGVWRLWRALETRSAAQAAGAGALAGLAYLTRPEGLVVVAGGALVATLLAWRARLRPLALSLWLTALVVGAAAFVLPYVAALHAETGAWALTGKKSVAVLVGIPSPRELAPPAAPEPAPEGVGAADTPGAARSKEPALEQYGRKARRAARYEILVLLALGIGASLGRPGPRAITVGVFFLLHAAILLQLVLNYGYVSRRHWFPPFAIAFGYAALGVPLLGRVSLGLLRALSRGRWPIFPSAATALGAAVALGFGLAQQREPRQLDELAARRAAEWLREQPDGTARVAAKHGRTAYYAGAGWVSLEAALARPDPLRKLVREGARYVIVDETDQVERLGLHAAGAARLLHHVQAEGREAWVFELASDAPSG